MKVAIYCRYSSDLQNPRSIEDQARLCREWIVRNGHTEGEMFADAAISGASAYRRPGFQQLRKAIEAGSIEGVVSEAMDRFSRNISDTNDLYEHCEYYGVKLLTVDTGEIGLMHVGLQSTLSALFLKGLADKVRRGQRGAFERGQSTGGLAYGYKVGAEPGSRVIDDAQSNIIRRIFREYLAGISPRSIAITLNKDGISSPKGGPWRASSIVGSRKRGNGILHNEIYSGVMVFGRQRRAKTPLTGKIIMQPVPETQWRRREVKDLQIIDRQTWQNVQSKLNKAVLCRLDYRRRPPRLLSGIITCGCCEGPMTIKDANRYVCRTAREEGQCSHSRPVKAVEVEGRVVTALQYVLIDDEFQKAFEREYRAHHAICHAAGPQLRAEANRRHDKANRAINELVNAIRDGVYLPEIKAALNEAEQARDAAKREMEAIELSSAPILPNLKTRFVEAICLIQRFLDEDTTAASNAKTTIRNLVGKVYIYPNDIQGYRQIEVSGDLATVIGGSGRGS